jgi:putative transcriptional regulator
MFLELKRSVIDILEKNGWVTYTYHGCFDVAAKKDKLLFLKVMKNIDGFQKTQAKNLKIISSSLNAFPLLIGLNTNREKLECGVVYERFELPVLSLETFENLIERKIFPRFYRDKGGLYVEISCEMLREARRSKGLTQKELAEIIGINKKTIYEHERKNLRMIVSLAEKIEMILEKRIMKPIEVFKRFEESGNPKDNLERFVDRSFRRLGFKTKFSDQTPFDLIAKESEILISDVERNKRRIKYRCKKLNEFVSFVEHLGIVITDKIKIDAEVPVIEKRELEEIESGKELIKIARG